MSGYCKGIYCGCCIAGCMSPCAPCERIRLGKSTVEKEMARKARAEHRAALPPRRRVTLPDMSATHVSSTGKTITIKCDDHDTKDALLNALTR